MALSLHVYEVFSNENPIASIGCPEPLPRRDPIFIKGKQLYRLYMMVGFWVFGELPQLVDPTPECNGLNLSTVRIEDNP